MKNLATLTGLLALLTISCVPAPETHLDDFWAKATEAGKYFPRLESPTLQKPKYLPTPTKEWVSAARGWSKSLAETYTAIDSNLLPDTRKQEYARAGKALRNLQHEVSLLESDVSAYNFYFWLKHLELLKGKPEQLEEALQKAPEYYRQASNNLSNIDPKTVATAVKEHTPFILWLSKQPGEAAKQARLAAKSYLGESESRAAYIIRNGKKVFK